MVLVTVMKERLIKIIMKKLQTALYNVENEKGTVPSYPWRGHLIKENETIAIQAVGQSRKLHFLIFKISITTDVAQAE